MDRKSRREASCVLCKTQFYFKDPTNPFGSRCPLLLHCGHTVCEGCVKSVTRNSKSVTCKICSEISEPKKFNNPEELREEFPLSIYDVGQLSLRKTGRLKSGDSAIGLYTNKKKMTSSNAVLCGECEVSSADCSCRQCKVQFCSPCFTKIHNVAVTLKKHERIPLVETGKSVTLEEAFCKEHPGQLLKFYCEGCLDYCCADCVFANHLKHSCVEVIQKNEEIFQEFFESYEEATSVLKTLYCTRKKLQQENNQLQNQESIKLESEVVMHFGRLHGLLQLQENEFVKKIRRNQSETFNSHMDIVNKIEKNIKEMETVLTESKSSMDPKNMNQMPLVNLLKKLKNVSTMPCHLMVNDDQSTSTYGFNIDDKIFDAIRDHCQINIPTKTAYELHSKFDLPDNYVPEALPDVPDLFEKPDIAALKTEASKHRAIKPVENTQSSIPKQLPPERKTKPSSLHDVLRRNRLSLNDHWEQLTAPASENSFDSLINTEPLVKDATEIVRMSLLVNANNFYVQRKSSSIQLEKLKDHFSKQANIKRNHPSEVELGAMYLVQYGGDKNWYRAVPKSVCDDKYVVYYVDYGNTEKVTKNRLREIPEKYIKIPEQAIHCSLYGCAPAKGNWSEDAFTLMTAMSHGFDLSMNVERISPASDLHEVHLCRIVDMNNFTDALIFMGYAYRTESTSQEEGLYKRSSSSVTKSFFKDVTVKKNETFDAQVTHINTPSNFFIQRLSDNGQLMLRLMADLNNVYNTQKKDDSFVFSPSIGMPVVAKFSDGGWYRAVVLSIPKTKHVEVQYIDFGNVETVVWSDIRVVQPKFLRIAAQGIKCTLSDVAPKHSQGWTSSAKKAFESMAKKQVLLRVYVEDVNELHTSVVLYEIQQSKDICLNGLLVQKGHAISVGPSSANSEYYRGVQKMAEEDILSTSSSLVAKSLPSLSAQLPLQSSLWGPLPSSKHQRLLSTASATSSEGTNQTSEEPEHDDKYNKYKIQILKLVSPDEIYITFEHISKQILKLVKDMTKHYELSEEDMREWAVGDLCAVLNPSDNKWYRGVLTERSFDKTTTRFIYKVYIKDVVEVVKVDSSHLRSLSPQFNTIMDGSVKCKLGAVVPPGGSISWPGTTLDYLDSIISEYMHFYITKLGDLVDDCLPIQLWAKNIKVGGALDPVVEDWVDIGKCLIDLGFALRDRTSKLLPELHSSSNVDKQDEYKVELHQDLRDWLHHTYEVSSKSPFVSDFEKMEITSQTFSPPLSTTSSKTTRTKRTSALPRHIATMPFNIITEWKPAEPFKRLDFIAIPTYVDYECAVYLQDKEQSGSTLELIQRALVSLFDGSVAKPHDLVWSPGQLCIAFYEPDGKWYRGKVLKVTDEHLEVIFVDYGNTEHLQPEELRKQITMGHIPIQCHRCLTEGLYPVSRDGKWPIKYLDFVHGTIVEKECRVRLNPPATEGGEYVILSLNVPGGQDLMEVLVSMHYVTYLVDCNQVGKTSDDGDIIDEQGLLQQALPALLDLDLRTEQPDNYSDVTKRSKSPPIVPHTNKPLYMMNYFDIIAPSLKGELEYTTFVIPDAVVEMVVEVTVVSSSTSLKVNIVECDDPEVMALMDEFAQVHGLIQEEAQDLPFITNPSQGLPCIGCFTEDNVWYRAIIKELLPQDDLVKVQYVDYGNEEIVPIDMLREIKDDWMRTPTQSINVSLFKVCEGPAYDPTNFQTKLMNCLMSPPYTMTIENRLPGLQVQLYNNHGEIAYQEAINMGILANV